MTINNQHRIRLLLCVALFWVVNTGYGQNVVDKLKLNKQANHFGQALEDANLDKKLSESGPFTLFAPSNEAFDALSSGQKSNTKLILNHVFTGMATERSLKVMSDVTCLSGRTITITEQNGQLTVDSMTILSSNIKAENGVIHIIDGVIE